MVLFHELDLIRVLGLLILWAIGGQLITLRVFGLETEEQPLVGVAVGMILSTWLFNFLGRWASVAQATWTSAAVTLGFGLALALPVLRGSRPAFKVNAGRWLAFGALALLFTLPGRGLGIFDDTQNLPFLSRIAAGDLPPHFPFNPDLRLGYHYFLLLIAAEWMGAANALPWAALDLARGVTMALAFLLVGQLAFRLTRKPMAEVIAVGFAALAGGARWMLLFLPVSLASRLSDSVTLLGSGASSGETLAQALLSSWALDGAGPVPFPFAYASGVFPPRILALSGAGVGALLVIMVILLAGDRVRSAWGWVVMTVLLASLALLHEPEYVLVLAGLLAVTVVRALRDRSPDYRRISHGWWATLAASVVLAAIQGGMLTELALRTLGRVSPQASYYDVTFGFIWPPTVVSSHLGALSLLNPFQLLAALLEFGPMVLVFPLVVLHGVAAWRGARYAESAVSMGGLLSLGLVFVQYGGIAGPTATTRLYGLFGDVCLIYAVPLAWLYLARRGTRLQTLGIVTGLAAVFSGLVMLGIQFTAIPRPVASTFLDQLDAQMFRRHWNTLPSGSMVFDPQPSRAVTVFGRAVDAQVDLSGPTEEYVRLAENPVPARLRAAGFDYLYADRGYWQRHQEALSEDCVRPVDEVVDILSATGEVGDFRRLVDLRQCP